MNASRCFHDAHSTCNYVLLSRPLLFKQTRKFTRGSVLSLESGGESRGTLPWPSSPSQPHRREDSRSTNFNESLHNESEDFVPELLSPHPNSSYRRSLSLLQFGWRRRREDDGGVAISEAKKHAHLPPPPASTPPH